NLNPDGVDDVVPHKAKARIRQFTKREERKVSEEGRDRWKKRAKRGSVEISDQDLMQVAHKLGFDSTKELFYEVGKGNFDVNKLFKAAKQFTCKGRIEIGRA